MTILKVKENIKMGTRNLIAVKLNGEYKVAQYSQWDGYSSGQGAGVLDFLHRVNLDEFKNKVAQTTWITQEEYDKTWDEVGGTVDERGFVSMEDSNKHKKAYPEFSRDTGSDILDLVNNSEPLKLWNDIDFAHDGLSCEWAYVIDFDKNTFEVFGGFCKEPLQEGERFYDGDKEWSDNYYDGRDLNFKYYGVRLLHTFDLSDLPTEEKFLEICEPKDEEESEDDNE